MKILFEGLDLAGKSTVCRLLHNHLGEDNYILRKNSILEENPIFTLADKIRKENTWEDGDLGYIFLAALLYDIKYFDIEQSENYIQDSTILFRSIAFHTAIETPKLPELFIKQISKLPDFDVVFYCNVSKETRLERLKKRNPANLGPEDFYFKENTEMFEKMETTLIYYLKQKYKVYNLNTEGDIKNDKDRIKNLLNEIIDVASLQ